MNFESYKFEVVDVMSFSNLELRKFLFLDISGGEMDEFEKCIGMYRAAKLPSKRKDGQ